MSRTGRPRHVEKAQLAWEYRQKGRKLIDIGFLLEKDKAQISRWIKWYGENRAGDKSEIT